MVARKRMEKKKQPREKNKTLVKRKPLIQEIVREPTAGGVVFRHNQGGELEILLIQDAKNRWTIPKGHIEPGETLYNTKIIAWLGEIKFRYRRMDKLVLMTTKIYLMKALGDTNAIQKEEWMNGVKWFKFNDALNEIEYEDIGKLMLIAKRKIRQKGL